MKGPRSYRSIRAVIPAAIAALQSAHSLSKTRWTRVASHYFFGSVQPKRPAPSQDLATKLRQLLGCAFSNKDRLRHTGEILKFIQWLRRHDLRLSAVTPRDVKLWLASVDAIRSSNAAIHAYTAIRFLLRSRNMFDPSEHRLVRMCLKALHKKAGKEHFAPTDPVTVEHLALTCDDTLRGGRDRGVILLLAVGVSATRLSHLRWKHVEFVGDGAVLRDKTKAFTISPGSTDNTCPVAALKALRKKTPRKKDLDCAVIPRLTNPRKGLSLVRLWEIVGERCAAAGLPAMTPYEFKRRFVTAVGRMGLDDVHFATVAGFERVESGRHLNVTAAPREPSGRHRNRTMRRNRGFAGSG